MFSIRLINSVQQFTTNVDLDAYMREEEDKCGSDVHCHWTSIVNKVIGTITKKHCVAATMYLYFKIYKGDL